MKSLQEQTKAIQAIFSKGKKIPDYRFTFGQYKGKTLEYVLQIDRKYLQWILTEEWPKPRLRQYVEQALRA